MNQQQLISLFSKFDEYPYGPYHVYREMPIFRAKMVAMETNATKKNFQRFLHQRPKITLCYVFHVNQAHCC